jgi:hypothetical protein
VGCGQFDENVKPWKGGPLGPRKPSIIQNGLQLRAKFLFTELVRSRPRTG